MRKILKILFIVGLVPLFSQVTVAAPGITAGFLVPADTAAQVDRDRGLKGMELEFIRTDDTPLEADAPELPLDIHKASVMITIHPEVGETRTVECKNPECRGGNLAPPPWTGGICGC